MEGLCHLRASQRQLCLYPRNLRRPGVPPPFSWLLTEALGVASLAHPVLFHFLRYTLRPTTSLRPASGKFPSVDAIMIVLPEDDGPKSLVRSTVIVKMFPLTDNSTFFMDASESPGRSARWLVADLSFCTSVSTSTAICFRPL